MLRAPAQGYPFSGLTISACPAVRRYGMTALMSAANNNDCAIVRKLVDARADVNTKNRISGCAFPGPFGALSMVRRLRRARAVRQADSAALGGLQRPHPMRHAAARRRRRPDHQ